MESGDLDEILETSKAIMDAVIEMDVRRIQTILKIDER